MATIRVVTIRAGGMSTSNRICECSEIDEKGQCDCFLNPQCVGVGHYMLPKHFDVFSNPTTGPIVYRVGRGPQESLGLGFAKTNNNLGVIDGNRLVSALKRVDMPNLHYAPKIDGTIGMYLTTLDREYA